MRYLKNKEMGCCKGKYFSNRLLICPKCGKMYKDKNKLNKCLDRHDGNYIKNLLKNKRKRDAKLQQAALLTKKEMEEYQLMIDLPNT